MEKRRLRGISSTYKYLMEGNKEHKAKHFSVMPWEEVIGTKLNTGN